MRRTHGRGGLWCSAVILVVLTATVMSGTPVNAETVTITPNKDNSIFSEGDLSNGRGQHLFTGRVAARGGGELRRALLSFDIAAAVPAGARVTAARLTLNMNRTIAGNEDVALHALTRDWGEGASDAPGEEGTGTSAMAPDATWPNAMHPDTAWTNEGGDFVASPSDVTSVGGNGDYTWSSAEMASDVQGWLDDPDSNFGWIVIGNEEELTTAKRFGSRETGDEEQRPRLEIEFEPAGAKVPATTPWGFAALTLALLGGAAWLFRRRRLATCESRF